MTVWKQGQRKAVYAYSALGAMMAGAAYLKADFPSFRDGLMLWLGLTLGAHVTQQATAKKPEAPAP